MAESERTGSSTPSSGRSLVQDLPAARRSHVLALSQHFKPQHFSKEMDRSFYFTVPTEICALPTAACSNIFFMNLTLLLTAEQIVSICWEWDRWQQKKCTWILWHKHWKSRTDHPPCKKVKKLVNILIKFHSILLAECLTLHTHIFKSLFTYNQKFVL